MNMVENEIIKNSRCSKIFYGCFVDEIGPLLPWSNVFHSVIIKIKNGILCLNKLNTFLGTNLCIYAGVRMQFSFLYLDWKNEMLFYFKYVFSGRI